MTSSLTWIDWTVVAVYMAAMIFMGWRAARGGRSLEDYFVGGRNIGAFAAGISLMATLLSTISYLACPGEVIAHGAGYLWQVLVLPVVFVVVGYFLIPHIMALPVTSAYELLETRLGHSIRTLAAGLFIVLRLFWMALIFHTAATAMAVITGVGREWLMLGMGVVTVIYTTEGGIRAVIWTDIAQFFVLLGGAVFTVVYLMRLGDIHPGALVRDGWVSLRQTPFFSFDPQVRTTAVSFMASVGFWWIATCGSDQIAMQRFFTNRDAKAARGTLLVNLLASIVTLFVLAFIGLTLLQYFTAHPDQLPADLRDLSAKGDKIFPHFIAHGMPTGLSGLVIAALFAAGMSSLSSGFNSLTTVLTVDFFERGHAEKLRETTTPRVRRRAQVTTLSIGVVTLGLGLLLKLVPGNFFELSSRVLEPWTGPLFGLFALAFFDRRATARSAWTGFAVGLASGFFVAHGHWLLGQKQPFSFLFIAPVSITATILTGLIASRILMRKDAGEKP